MYYPLPRTLAGVLLLSAIATNHAAAVDTHGASQPSAVIAFEASHYPSKKTAEQRYDELDCQRALQTYIRAQPLVGLAAMREDARKMDIAPMDLFVFDKLASVGAIAGNKLFTNSY